MLRRRLSGSLPIALCVLSFARLAAAADPTVPGQVSSPYPTFQNLSLEWAISGDDDADGQVSVKYRKQGESAYRDGLPLVRVPAGSNEGFSWANRHAGSVFGLEPGTTYEIELTLVDPDGGGVTQSLVASTRALPIDPPAPNEIAVTPSTIEDALSGAVPGDVLVLADGTYGSIVVQNDGAAGNPIVLRAANPAGAIIEGEMRLDGRSFVHVEGLAIHGRLKMNDASEVKISKCIFDTQGDGIISYGEGLTNAYIVDNVITGATQWSQSALGVDGDNIGEGVQFTGPGNVIAFNRISGFRDCISLMEDDEAVNQVSIDIYGNDLDLCADDAVEADFSMGNVRVYQNRINRSFMGLSSQPSLGGPTYFIRNVLYNVVYQSFKLQRSSVGDVGFHNTSIKSGDAFSVFTDDVFSRSLFRNNLFLGGPGGSYNGYSSGDGNVMSLAAADASCSFDYDGYGSIGTGTFEGRVGGVTFDSLAELQSSTTEAHAVQLDLGAFATSITYPSEPFADPPMPSFTLAGAGAAIDRGVALANVSDGFTGTAPDLGAYEAGLPEPTYGPDGSIPSTSSSASSSSSTTSTGSGGPGATSGSGAGNGGDDGGDGGAGAGRGGEDDRADDGDGCSCDTSGPTASGWWLSIAAMI
ncbi:MAG: hypothetical protein HOV80_10030, partial [Polyangiaceae bacterium]|nr:hypothetical protein [Polyangiaceae bacterium]